LTQLKEHINTEIALRTVRNLQDIVDHVKRTFLYVRMLSSPLTYGIKTRDNVEVFLVDRCTETVNDLNKYEMIRFSEDSKQIVPL
jgi:replicative superfamily II helicase